MVFDKKISIMDLVLDDKTYAWQLTKQTWAHMEHQTKNNLFSRVGIGVKTVVFTLRKTTGLSLHKALSHNGRQYFITDINRDDPVLMVATAADIQPKVYTKYVTKVTKGPNKEPVYSTENLLQFPAAITEKYLGYEQKEPMAQATKTFVLVTPKAIALSVNDLVQTEGGEKYAVQVCHLLDDYKNEYEITRKGDV